MGIILTVGCIKETIGCAETYPSADEYKSELANIEKLIDQIKILLKEQTGQELDWPEYHHGEEHTFSHIDISIPIPSFEALHQLRIFASNLESIEKKKKIGFGVKIMGLLNNESEQLSFDTPASEGLNLQYERIEKLRSQGKQIHIPVESVFVKGLNKHLLNIYKGEEQTQFPHLIYHSDCSGFYIPCKFEKPLWIDSETLGEGKSGLVSVGSSLTLLEELLELNKYLDINLLEVHDLNNYQQKVAQEDLGLVKLTWAVLYTICLHSKKYTMPLILAT